MQRVQLFYRKTAFTVKLLMITVPSGGALVSFADRLNLLLVYEALSY